MLVNIQIKFDKLANEDKLKGVSYWVLAQPFPQNWAVLSDMFNIKKIAR